MSFLSALDVNVKAISAAWNDSLSAEEACPDPIGKLPEYNNLNFEYPCRIFLQCVVLPPGPYLRAMLYL